MNSLAVIRAEDDSKLKTALCDLVKYGNISYASVPKRLEPGSADSILVSVMKSPLKRGCMAAAIVLLVDSASTAIGRLRGIHPPAHVIIVSPRHEIYHKLICYIEMLPEAFKLKYLIQKKSNYPIILSKYHPTEHDF